MLAIKFPNNHNFNETPLVDEVVVVVVVVVKYVSQAYLSAYLATHTYVHINCVSQTIGL